MSSSSVSSLLTQAAAVSKIKPAKLEEMYKKVITSISGAAAKVFPALREDLRDQALVKLGELYHDWKYAWLSFYPLSLSSPLRGNKTADGSN